MRTLGIDIGSSSVKAGLLAGDRLLRVGRASYRTDYSIVAGLPRAGVPLHRIERAVRAAIRDLGDATADRIALSTMSPSLVLLDSRGRPTCDVITHQDRRSLYEARELETRIGKARHLKLAGNRPVPGGISSTSLAWLRSHERAAFKRSAFVAHLGTWLAHALTDRFVMDRSNAGFTGLLDVRSLDWSDELLAASDLDRARLPELVDSDAIVGRTTSEARRRFGVPDCDVVAGCVDGSASMFATGARVGQVVNVCGSTDVLAVCVDRPRPDERLITRPLGVGRKWLSVGTIAAAGTAIDWARRTLFADLDAKAFYRHLHRLPVDRETHVRCAALFAGSRTAIEPIHARFENLTLATGRDELLVALLADLARQSDERFDALRDATRDTRWRTDVLSTGGGEAIAAKWLRRKWPARFAFRSQDESTLRGLAALGVR